MRIGIIMDVRVVLKRQGGIITDTTTDLIRKRQMSAVIYVLKEKDVPIGRMEKLNILSTITGTVPCTVLIVILRRVKRRRVTGRVNVKVGY